MKKLFFAFVLISSLAWSQEDEKIKSRALRESKDLTWEGNKDLSENKFVEAEVEYRKAIAKSDENVAAPYNLGNAYYTKETYSEAFGRFKEAGELASEKADKHKAYHNMGNVFMKRKEYEKAVEAYKQALRNGPNDEETRYNLALAKEMLKKEQQQNDQNKDKEDKDDQDQKDKNEDKKEGDNKEENKDQDQKDQGDKGDQKEDQKEDQKDGEGDQKEEQQKQPEQGEQQQEQQPRPNQLSKQQIQNLLEAMQNEEKKVQEKIDAQKVKGVKVKNEKDW